MTEPPGTDPLVAVQDRLAALPTLPLSEHPAVFEDIHRLLRRALDLGGAPVQDTPRAAGG